MLLDFYLFDVNLRVVGLNFFIVFLICVQVSLIVFILSSSLVSVRGHVHVVLFVSAYVLNYLNWRLICI